jgi:hypothetical protein
VVRFLHHKQQKNKAGVRTDAKARIGRAGSSALCLSPLYALAAVVRLPFPLLGMTAQKEA